MLSNRPRLFERGATRPVDPRLSIEERYPTFSMYYFGAKKAIDDLVANRFYLPEDAGGELNRVLQAGLSTGAIKLDGVYKDLIRKGALHEVVEFDEEGTGASPHSVGALRSTE